jgi:predicted PurR-regulated permease PerM
MPDLEGKKDGGSKFTRGYRPFLLVALFFSFYLVYLILRPFMDTLILAIVLASLFSPLQAYLVRQYRGRANLAALTIVFIITFLMAIPVSLFTSALVSQGVDTVNQINDWIRAGNIQKLTEDPRILAYSTRLQEKLPFLDLNKLDIPTNLLQLSKNLGQFLLSRVGTLLGNAASLITHFFVMIFVVFYLVRDGERMIDQVRYFSPLRTEQEDRIIDGTRVVARSVLVGTFVTAICQGLVGGLGLAIVGIPGLFWGTVMAFASLIPVIGTSLVSVPAIAYLLLFGSWKSAVFLTFWCILLLGSIDNFLRPFLMQGGSKLSPFYIFLAIIGGVQYFGLIGILYGPLILTFAMIMLVIYEVEYREDLLGADLKTPKAGSGMEVI